MPGGAGAHSLAASSAKGKERIKTVAGRQKASQT